MANILILFTSLILSIGNPSAKMKEKLQENKVTTYYLIRHAEKDRTQAGNRDPLLNEQGQKRAQKWAEVMKDVDFDAIYSTNYKRTIETAKPLAKLKELEVLNYDPRNLYNEDFKKATSGKTVLVVGHSNTTPHFANAILGEKRYQDIDDKENGALFIVQVQPDGSATCQVLYIN
ncbi:histidine phosphatase family protein [Gramella jeungdoensis]|uniref:Histidine phosphatase family protein n=1 Tax=Gramella jeungdoensis TaxID=708091 RepID=A0ABT0YXI0_9FLAO|nr:phosphoglycerate mutase family protein [Gramella jeungdoensis]MCM8568177.1 histidine phosphatase family protein [Gramella jeungdoensis]